MFWFNYYGLAIIAIIMVPNVIFMLKHSDGLANLWSNRSVETLEQIGRYGCFVLMIFNIPYTVFGFWTDDGLRIYLALNAVLTLLYCFSWSVFATFDPVLRAVVLSVLPSVVFLFSGIMILSVPLIVAACIFAPCHIIISCKNALTSKTKTRSLKIKASE